MEILPAASQSDGNPSQQAFALLSVFLHGEARAQQRLANNLATVCKTRDEVTLQLRILLGAIERGRSNSLLRLWRRDDLKGIDYKVRCPKLIRSHANHLR
jgi:hypothetical protein